MVKIAKPGRTTILVIAGIAAALQYANLERQESSCKQSLYGQAISYEKNNNFQSAYQIYSYLCDAAVYNPPPGNEHPCTAHARLSTRFDESRNEVFAALSAYRHMHNAYPPDVTAILDSVSPANREMARTYTFCWTVGPSNAAATCSDGGTAFIIEELSVVTRQSTGQSFDLDPKPKRPFRWLTPKSCVYAAAQT
jgi:hypothetical protein